MASFPVRAERMRPAADLPDRPEVRRLAVDCFGSIPRHVLKPGDAQVLKLDQFGAEPSWLALGGTTTIGWDTADAVLHRDPAGAAAAPALWLARQPVPA